MRAPNFTEIRNQLYQAIAHGALGCLWYTYTQRENWPCTRLSTDYLVKEAMALKEVILTPESTGRVYTEAGGLDISTSLREYKGNLYLFAVNKSTKSGEVKFRVKGLGSDTLFVVSEDRKIKPYAGEFTDHFKIYDTHIYTTNSNLTELATLPEVEKEIKKAEIAQWQPGNLAYRLAGAKVESERNNRANNASAFLNDGSYQGQMWGQHLIPQLPTWIKVTFPKPQQISRVIIYGKLSDYLVCVKKDGSWETVAEVKDNREARVESKFSPVKTDAIRLWITKAQGKKPIVSEIEVYK